MTLKNCPCCKLKQTTKNAIKKDRDEYALYFNCKNCQSTFIIRFKDWEVRKAIQNQESTASTIMSRKVS